LKKPYGAKPGKTNPLHLLERLTEVGFRIFAIAFKFKDSSFGFVLQRQDRENVLQKLLWYIFPVLVKILYSRSALSAWS